MFNRRFLLGLFGSGALLGSAKADVRPARTREPVLLLRSRVNGERYYDAFDAIDTLAVGAPLQLRREPDNPYDPRAIEVLDAVGYKLGYLARIDNPAVARMIDAGEHFTATVSRLDAATLDIGVDVHWRPDA